MLIMLLKMKKHLHGLWKMQKVPSFILRYPERLKQEEEKKETSRTSKLC